ncbi:hypothetical protein [Dysgonomonas sp. ZJ279]|uniref:hypothetical protein n=1 Tax=Dysgonomonas sp. ZJ279 TaxID=2709796 RepID=UPI0013E9EEDA|nr:hypothetical protein [Dysgonomonas sp. ZJ279]
MKKIIFLFTLVLTLCMNSDMNARTNADEVNATPERVIDLGVISSPHRFTVYIDPYSEKYVGTAAAILKISENSDRYVTFEISNSYDYSNYGTFYYEIYTLDLDGKYKGFAVVGTFKN